MALNAVIGALRVSLGIDSAAFEKGLKGASKTLNSFAVDMAKIGAGVALAMTALGLSVKGAINEADKLGKMAQSIGIPVEELSKLKHAADLSDVSLESLSKSVGILSKNMVTAAAGASQLDVKGSKATQAFKDLKIDVEAAGGGLKSSTEIMTEVAAKFGGMEDSARKSQLAMALFGKSGKELIPLLNQGADGLRNMMDEAGALGIVIDSKTSAAAERFNDNLKRMGKIKDGIILQVTAAMLPAFEQLSKVMLDTAKNSDQLANFAGALTAILRSAVSVGMILQVTIARLGADLFAFFNLLNTLRTQDIFGDWSASKKALADLGASLTESGIQFKALDETVKRFWTDTENAAAAADPVFRRMTAPIIEGNKAAKNALESYLASQAKALAGHAAEAQTIGLLTGAKERLKVTLEATAIAQANSIILTDKQRAAIEAASIAAGNMALKIAGLMLTEETLLGWERFNKSLDLNRQMFDAGVISLETYERANKRVAETAAATWDIAGASIAGSFATIAGSFGTSSSGMATAAKAFGIVQAIISTYTGAAKALELPFPANLAAMATVLAKGFAFVASIKSTPVPKFAKGADFIVGGSSGIDNNRITMDVSRGERVRVDPVGSDAALGMGGQSRVVHELRMDPRVLITGEYLRELIGNINAAGRDGYRLEFART